MLGRQLCGRRTPRGCWPPGRRRRLCHRARQSPGPAALPGDDAGGGRDRRGLAKGHRRREGPGRPRGRPARRRRGQRRLGICLGQPAAGGGIGAARSPRPVWQGAGRPPHRRRPGAAGPSGPRPGPPRPHGGPGGDRAAATGRAAGRLRARVLESLCFFAGRQRRPPRPGRRPQRRRPAGTGEKLSGLGYQADTADQRPRGPPLALASPDYEVAFIDSTIDDPPVGLLLQQLRHDCRTAGLRVGLLRPRAAFRQAQHVAGEDPLCMAFSRPHDQESVALAVGPTGHARRPRNSSASGAAVAGRPGDAAAGRLGGVLGQALRHAPRPGHGPDGLVHAGVGVPACEVLTHLGTPEAQRALVELASRPTQPIAARQAAATRFASMRRNSACCSTTAEVRRQYDRYQAKRRSGRRHADVS